MIRRVVAVMAILGCGVARADDPLPLKPGPGQALVIAHCNACHTTDYIVMNSPFLSAEAWRAEVAKMRTAFGAPMDDSVARQIAGYLAGNYAAPPKQ